MVSIQLNITIFIIFQNHISIEFIIQFSSVDACRKSVPHNEVEYLPQDNVLEVNILTALGLH